jgi:thioredoxin-related protein
MKILKLLFVLLITQLSFAQMAQINWVTFEEAMELNQKEKKHFFFDVYTDWCGYCKKMDKTTFSHPQIAAYMNEHFYCIKFNAEKNGPIDYEGKTYQVEGNYHTFATVVNGGQRVKGYPTVSFLDTNFNVISPIGSYLDGPTFEMIVKYIIGQEAQKGTAFPDWQKTFKNEFSF